LENAIYNHVRNSATGVATDPDNMALDVIQSVGPRGHYLKEKHTRENFRKFNFSDVLYVPEMGGGYQDALEVAREKTDWILKNHHPEQLSIAKQTELSRIIAAAERELTDIK